MEHKHAAVHWLASHSVPWALEAGAVGLLWIVLAVWLSLG